MALSDVLKKKTETGEAAEKSKSGAKKNPLDDVRIVIAIIVIACIALIVLTVFASLKINKTGVEIGEQKQKYSENQAAISNLRNLQAQSEEFKSRRDEYNTYIKEGDLDLDEIMIDLQNSVYDHNCKLTELTFDDESANGNVKQIAVHIKVVGKFENIVKFCSDKVNEKPIKRIDQIKMGEPDDNGIITADITVVEFAR